MNRYLPPMCPQPGCASEEVTTTTYDSSAGGRTPEPEHECLECGHVWGSSLGDPFQAYFRRHIDWSRETFGPGRRTQGIIEHIKRELAEVAATPDDLEEWVDVIILAMDGYWRHGGAAAGAEGLMTALITKQVKNMARTWSPEDGEP